MTQHSPEESSASSPLAALPKLAVPAGSAPLAPAAAPPRGDGEDGADLLDGLPAPGAGDLGPGDPRLAMLAYLTVPVFGFVVPLWVRLTAGRRSPWLRGHAVQALNVWLTVALYDVSAAIMGAMLALDSPVVAAVVMVPLLVTLWGFTVSRLLRAANAASLGGSYPMPRWLCSQIVR